ncbi:MAG TPA: MBL fold metallo-hydrolase [Anaerolineaceae bacterium]|nr:MBL fold metallo-hydrolase [Anaerolineaceae bacterium]
MEVFPGVYQLKIPIPNNPLGFINAYLVKTPEGSLLIDTGWNTDQSFEALEQQLAEAGVTFDNLKYIAITHIHPDHYGLVGRLAKYTKARLIIHEIERSLLYSRYVNYDDLLNEMDQWLKINGVPSSDRPKLRMASLEILGMVEVAMPDQVVHGGEHITLGDFDLEIVWTPGHSPGHICLYDRARKVLFSGDHILQKTTPNVSMNSQSIGNPLVDYLNSLHQISKLPVDLVLPAHGQTFNHLPERLKELQHHHETRMNEIVAAFNGEPKTAYTIASSVTWYVPWQQLEPFSKRMAVTETLAHLELLLARGVLTKTMQDGFAWYSVANQNGA